MIASLLALALYTGLLIQLLRERDLIKEMKPRQAVYPFRAVFAFSFRLISGTPAAHATRSPPRPPS